jgi:hypothetical protein
MGLTNDQRYAAHRGGLSSGAALRAYSQPADSPLQLNTQVKNTNLIPTTTSFSPGSGTAYFVYLGQVARIGTYNKIYFVTSGAATGALVQELGVATTPEAPNGALQTLTIRALNSTAGDYTGAAGRYSNTTNLAYTPPVGEHIWVFARWQPAGTQVTISTGLCCDLGQYSVFTFASIGTALTLGQVITTPTAVSVTATTGIAPVLILATS